MITIWIRSRNACRIKLYIKGVRGWYPIIQFPVLVFSENIKGNWTCEGMQAVIAIPSAYIRRQCLLFLYRYRYNCSSNYTVKGIAVSKENLKCFLNRKVFCLFIVYYKITNGFLEDKVRYYNWYTCIFKRKLNIDNSAKYKNY